MEILICFLWDFYLLSVFLFLSLVYKLLEKDDSVFIDSIKSNINAFIISGFFYEILSMYGDINSLLLVENFVLALNGR